MQIIIIKILKNNINNDEYITKILTKNNIINILILYMLDDGYTRKLNASYKHITNNK